MQAVFENIIEKLEEQKKGNPFVYGKNDKNRDASVSRQSLDYAIEIVKQEAKQYNNAIIDGKYCFQTCACTEKCNKCSRLCNGDIDWYENIDNWTEKYNNGWIPCSERLPEEHKQYDITTKNEVGIHSDTAIYNPFLGMWFWDEAESKHIEIEVLAWAEKRESYQPKGE